MEDRPAIQDIRTETTERILQMVQSKVTNLTGIWSDVGFNFETTQQRLDRTKAHVSRLLDQMIQSETEWRDQLLKNIVELTSELQNLSSELDVAYNEVPDSMPISEKEKATRERVERLRKLKRSRQREWEMLRAKESELCASLGVATLNLCSVSVPSEKDLQELQKRVAALEKDKLAEEQAKQDRLKNWEDYEETEDTKPHEFFEDDQRLDEMNVLRLEMAGRQLRQVPTFPRSVRCIAVEFPEDQQ
ncbi:hypothetical protein HPB50_027773 [Hyalomma asiaticum]|nr:hypothetical protein HPB50_027773 [Hyalomma asiaticum]